MEICFESSAKTDSTERPTRKTRVRNSKRREEKVDGLNRNSLLFKENPNLLSTTEHRHMLATPCTACLSLSSSYCNLVQHYFAMCGYDRGSVCRSLLTRSSILSTILVGIPMQEDVKRTQLIRLIVAHYEAGGLTQCPPWELSMLLSLRLSMWWSVGKSFAFRYDDVCDKADGSDGQYIGESWHLCLVLVFCSLASAYLGLAVISHEPSCHVQKLAVRISLGGQTIKAFPTAEFHSMSLQYCNHITSLLPQRCQKRLRNTSNPS